MNTQLLRFALTLLLVLVLAGGVLATVWWYPWLDQFALGGPAIVGLAFSAIAIFGIHAQLAAELPDDTPPGLTLRRFRTYVGQMAIFIPAFAGGIWLVLRAVNLLLPSVLPEAFLGPVAVLAFLGYMTGVIGILTWLVGRGIIGDR